MKSMINQQSKHGSQKTTKVEKKAKGKANQSKSNVESAAKQEGKTQINNENNVNKPNTNEKDQIQKVE